MFKFVWERPLEANGDDYNGDTSLLGGSPRWPEIEPPVPGKAPLYAPRSSSSASALVLSPGSPRAAAWGGSGSLVWMRGVGYRSAEPVRLGR